MKWMARETLNLASPLHSYGATPFLSLNSCKFFFGFTKNDDWNLFVDCSKCIHRVGIVIILINPHGDVIPISYQ